MSLAGRIRERAVDFLEDSTGLTITDKEAYGSLLESSEQFRQFREEADDLAHWTMSYFTGRPSDLRPEKQRELAQKSRVAWGRDPIAGTEAEHYANFSIGRGVNRPRARNEKVQRVINRAWKDSNNADHLLNPDALHALSNELRAGANVYVLAFVGGGRVRVSFLEADSVEAIVADEPEDRLRPLYYVAHRTEATWDFEKHARVIDRDKARVLYYPHWRNVEEAEKEYAAKTRDSAPLSPPKGKLGEGVVYHVRVNRLLEQQFGMPFWNRTLRFFSAVNRLMEARVSMAQASASIIAKTVMQGSERDIIKSAESLQRRTGEFGSAPVPGGMIASGATPGGFRPPIGPGAFNQENPQSRLEAVSLNSGAGNAVQDINIVRGAATSPSAMGPHYFGDTSGGQTQGAVLELPALMAMGAWQETIERLLRWFTDMAIQEAVRAGELGAGVTDKEEEDGPFKLGEFQMCEADDVEKAEKRLKLDLSYSFEMPYPGRRNLAEVTTTFTQVLTQLSPIGENSELTETMLNFLFTHGMQMEDAAELAERVNKVQQGLLKRQAESQEAGAAGAEGSVTAPPPEEDPAPPKLGKKGKPGEKPAPEDGGNASAAGPQGGSTKKRSDDSKRSQYGEPRKAAEQKKTGVYEMVEDPELRDLLEDIAADYEAAVARVSS